MSSIEMLGLGVRLLGAFTLAVTLVLALRLPFRRFGAETAFWLWALVPLAMLVALWPHASTSSAWLQPMTWMESAAASGQVNAVASPTLPVASWLLAVWVAGCIVVLLFAGIAQWRFARTVGDARTEARQGIDLLIRRARSLHAGPALMGWRRPVIVLPADFEVRYDTVEQGLILAHEAAHARRLDNCWGLAALVVLALCWIHPLAWFARSRFRLDLELACDATVMREHAAQRRIYANALVKHLPVDGFLPFGSTWSQVHPLKERIAMLKQSRPHPVRRAMGAIVFACCGVMLASAVYAATGSAAKSSGKAEYQLDLSVERSWDDQGKRHSDRAELSLCMPAGEAGTVKVRDWTADASVTPQADGRVNVKVQVNDGAGNGSTRVDGALDQALHTQTKVGEVAYRFDMTPRQGCPARDQAAKKA